MILTETLRLLMTHLSRTLITEVMPVSSLSGMEMVVLLAWVRRREYSAIGPTPPLARPSSPCGPTRPVRLTSSVR